MVRGVAAVLDRRVAFRQRIGDQGSMTFVAAVLGKQFHDYVMARLTVAAQTAKDQESPLAIALALFEAFTQYQGTSYDHTNEMHVRQLLDFNNDSEHNSNKLLIKVRQEAGKGVEPRARSFAEGGLPGYQRAREGPVLYG